MYAYNWKLFVLSLHSVVVRAGGVGGCAPLGQEGSAFIKLLPHARIKWGAWWEGLGGGARSKDILVAALPPTYTRQSCGFNN